MKSLHDVLEAFEQALELERLLNVRTVPCDRALLTQVKASTPLAPPPPPQPSRPAPTVESTSAPAHPPQKCGPDPTLKVDFAFITTHIPTDESGVLFEKMIRAMGYTRDQIVVEEASQAATHPPLACIYIVLGSDAFHLFAPNQKAMLGLWTTHAGVPTVVTYSLQRMLKYYGSDVQALSRAKHELWQTLQSARARLEHLPSL